MVMALNAYAIFSNGAYFQGPMTVCIVGAWSVVLLLLFANPRETLSGWSVPVLIIVSLFGILWIWTGLSVFWSVSPDQSWIEFNRTGGYLAIYLLGAMISRQPHVRTLAPALFLMAATSAAIYGIGTKGLPSIIDNLENVGRVSVPIGYSNAMGLLMAMAYPMSLYFAGDHRRHWMLRLASMLTGIPLLLCLFFTLSRGATLAFCAGLVFYFAVTPFRLKAFGLLITSLIPVFLISLWTVIQDALLQDGVETALKLSPASSLRWYLAFALTFSGLVFVAALLIGRYVSFPKIITRVAGVFTLISLITVTAVSGALFVTSKTSFVDWSRQAYHDFRWSIPAEAGAGRFLEMGSSGRWQLWEEAVANWEDNPVGGTGGQSFPLVHLMRRTTSQLYVKQPHGLPFRLLAELGSVGFLLGITLLMAIFISLSRLLCRMRKHQDVGLVAAIGTVMLTYLIHTSFDWDWNMFALSMIFFLFSGLITAWPSEKKSEPMIIDGSL
ncbi:MAG: O-antigen ligase family protein [Thermoleophilia bacterium]